MSNEKYKDEFFAMLAELGGHLAAGVWLRG